VIVLDPAHGGTDTGARGPEGRVEKDLVLQIVGTMRAELERRGYRVVTTRNDDSNPSYAQAYYDQFGTNVAPVLDGAGVTGVAERPANPPPGGLTNWNEAQRSFLDPSHRLANLIQLQLTQIFPGSPTVSEAAAVRGLRSIDEPAVAVELSSVSTSSPDSLRAAAAPLARAIAQSAAAFRQGGPGEAR
jgi:N-acetylmuramoyl-L-alanine amidase